MADLSQIPEHGLAADLAETMVDIGFCRLELAGGATTYGAGHSIGERLERNLQIARTIESEQARRRLTNAPAQAVAAESGVFASF